MLIGTHGSLGNEIKQHISCGKRENLICLPISFYFLPSVCKSYPVVCPWIEFFTLPVYDMNSSIATVTVVIITNGMWKSTNRKNSCSTLDTNDPKTIDTSFESAKCKL